MVDTDLHSFNKLKDEIKLYTLKFGEDLKFATIVHGFYLFRMTMRSSLLLSVNNKPLRFVQYFIHTYIVLTANKIQVGTQKEATSFDYLLP